MVVRAARRRGALSQSMLPTVRTERVVGTRNLAPLAHRLWSDARDIGGPLAERYLTGRGVMPPWTDLRYHPRAPIGAGPLVTFGPTLGAAVRDCTGLVGVHGIVLDPQTGDKAADLDNPKLTLGKPKAGAVRLLKATRTIEMSKVYRPRNPRRGCLASRYGRCSATSDFR
jgi:hypothetical protein